MCMVISWKGMHVFNCVHPHRILRTLELKTTLYARPVIVIARNVIQRLLNAPNAQEMMKLIYKVPMSNVLLNVR